VYESLIICEKELYDKIDSRIVSLFYKTYPSLIPFSGIAMPMRLHSNEKTENEKIIINQLKSSNINWIKTSSEKAIDVYIQFSHKGNLNLIEFTVKNKNEILIPPTSFSYDNSTMEWVPKQLCFYIFNVGNADKGINMK
jgi:dihydrodipicolinate reductase